MTGSFPLGGSSPFSNLKEARTMPWTTQQMPDCTGWTVLVTGANSGIGLEATREFARRGAHVVMACRSEAKAREAIAHLGRDVPTERLEFLALDLMSLESVREAARTFQSRHGRLDRLVNNAGIMAVPLHRTVDGFESQMATNHLGHFLVTARLWSTLLATPQARIVNVSSMAHRMGRLPIDDLAGQGRYSPWARYGQTKLANLLFTLELDRRIREAGHPVKAVACHPGYSNTNLQFAAPRLQGSRLGERISAWGNRWLAQSAAMGALPTLFAATVEDVPGGAFVGPDGFMEMRGYPQLVTPAATARDTDAARRLWEESERLTDTRFSFTPEAASIQA